MIERRAIRPAPRTIDPRSAELRAPDLGEHVIGYRAWRVGEDDALEPLGMGVNTWDGAREVRARCIHVEDFRRRTGAIAHMRPDRKRPSFCWHVSPDHDCDCGLHAWHDVARIAARGGRPRVVVGAIAAHGILELHAEGFRAELARPVLFAYHADAGNRDDVELLGLRHGIPTCDHAQLAERALEFGRPVPAWMLPIAPREPPS